MVSFRPFILLAASLATVNSVLAAATAASTTIYTGNALLGGWQDASAYSTVNYGADTISVASKPYGSFAIKNPSVNLASSSGISLDIKGSGVTYLYASLQNTLDTTHNVNSKGVQLNTNNIKPDTFTTVKIDFAALSLGNGPWDSISFQTADSGATYEVDNIALL